MGHVRQEFGLVLAGRLKLAALVLDLEKQACVLERQGRLSGEGGEKVDYLSWELAGRSAAND